MTVFERLAALAANKRRVILDADLVLAAVDDNAITVSLLGSTGLELATLVQRRDQLLALCDGVENVLLEKGDARPAAVSIAQIRDILGGKA